MIGRKVQHVSFGNGIITEFSAKKIRVKFESDEKTFVFPDAFERFISTDDNILLEAIEISKASSMKAVSDSIHLTNDQVTINEKKEQHMQVNRHGVSNSLLGPRSQSIDISSEYEMFEIVGYMANPSRVSSIEAEVPKDGRNELFEKMFPGQKYRPIELGYTPSGMPNKVSPQFRINFKSLTNCPEKLKAHMGKGNGSCVGRINKSKFVIEIVQNYGFRFGEIQDIEFIKKNAEKKGYLDAYIKGFKKVKENEDEY